MDSVIFRVPRGIMESRLTKYDKFLRGLIRVLVNNLPNMHKIYMKRPRSVEDNINAISFHLSNLRHYMGMPRTKDISEEGLTRLGVISDEIEGMKSLLKGHRDRRESVLDRSDLTTQGRPDPMPEHNPDWDEESHDDTEEP